MSALINEATGRATRPRREVADYIAARLAEVEWEVSYAEPEQLGSPPPAKESRADSRS